MLQKERFHRGGCMHEYSVELNDNFVVKTNKILHNPLKYLHCTGILTIF